MKKIATILLCLLSLSAYSQIKNYKKLYPYQASMGSDGSGYVNHFDKDSLEIFKPVPNSKDSSQFETIKQHPYDVRAFSVIDKNNNLKYYPVDSLWVERTIEWKCVRVTKTIIKNNKIVSVSNPYWKRSNGTSSNSVYLNSSFYFGKSKTPITIVQLFKDK